MTAPPPATGPRGTGQQSTGQQDAGSPSTGSPSPGFAGTGRSAGAWAGAVREMAVAGLLAGALAAAAWALDGPPAAAVSVLGCAAFAVILLRPLIDQGEQAPPPPVHYADRPAQMFHGFWRTQADLAEASRSLAAWDLGARGKLTNLFAARLAERHGISLEADPQAAKRLLLRVPSRFDLWFWIDPGRPTPRNAETRPGIPPHVLAALIDRLEQL